MHSINYNELNETEQLSYNRDYMTAMQNNDLPTVEHLTKLGTPIAFDNGAECSSLYQMFSHQSLFEISQSTDLIVYLFEHGIHNSKVDEVEQNIILTYAFDKSYFKLMDYFIEYFDFNKFTKYDILANCIGSLLILKEYGAPHYLNKWLTKNYPIMLDNCEDLNYLWQQRNSVLFKKQLALHVHQLDKFIENFGVLTKLKNGCLNLSDNNDINIMSQHLIATINQLPQEKWLNIIASLDNRINSNSNELDAKNIKSIITYNRYSDFISPSSQTVSISKKKI